MTQPERRSYGSRFETAELAAAYSALYRPGSYDHTIWLIQRAALEAYLDSRSQAHPGGRVLDYACGTGRATQVLAHRFTEVWGVDSSAAMLAAAQGAVTDATFVRADVLVGDWPAPPQFDLCTCFRLALNVEPSVRTEIFRGLQLLLKDRNGVLVVNNHGNRMSIRTPLMRLRRGDLRNTLSRRTIVGELRRAGFREIRCIHGVGHVPPQLYRTPLVRIATAVDRLLSRNRLLWRLAIDQMYVAEL